MAHYRCLHYFLLLVCCIYSSAKRFCYFPEQKPSTFECEKDEEQRYWFDKCEGKCHKMFCCPGGNITITTYKDLNQCQKNKKDSSACGEKGKLNPFDYEDQESAASTDNSVTGTEPPDEDPNAIYVDSKGKTLPPDQQGGEESGGDDSPPEGDDSPPEGSTGGSTNATGTTGAPGAPGAIKAPGGPVSKARRAKSDHIRRNPTYPEDTRATLLEIGSLEFCGIIPESGIWCNPKNKQASVSLRYYFAPNINSCVCFYFFGCNGNANNFPETNDCTQYCGNSSTNIINENCIFFP